MRVRGAREGVVGRSGGILSMSAAYVDDARSRSMMASMRSPLAT